MSDYNTSENSEVVICKDVNMDVTDGCIRVKKHSVTILELDCR